LKVNVITSVVMEKQSKETANGARNRRYRAEEQHIKKCLPV
jgi:hypothetical protein